MQIPISVLILTKNEAKDLPACLDSVAWSDDIFVFDSLSDDDTVTVAKAGRACVIERAFDGYASQRNAALTTLPFRHPWVLILDADERVTSALVSEMREFVAGPEAVTVAACRLRRRDFFMGSQLRHAQISPFYIRLVRPERARYEREINEVVRVDGVVHDLCEPFDHFPFSKGLQHWFEKHNHYSTMEAHQVVKARQGTTAFSLKRAVLSRDFNERRFHQKQAFYRMPFRPALKWVYMVAFRRAFLDGHAGLIYASLQSVYEYMIVLKTHEMEAARRQQQATHALPSAERGRPASGLTNIH